MSDEAGLVYHVRMPADCSYPDLSLPIASFSGEKGMQITLPSEISGALEKAKVFLDKTEKGNNVSVRLTIKPNSMRLKGEGDLGWYEEVFRLGDYSGPEFVISVVPEQLVQMLPVTNTVFMFPGMGLKFEGDDFVYIFTCMKEPDYVETESEGDEEAEDEVPF